MYKINESPILELRYCLKGYTREVKHPVYLSDLILGKHMQPDISPDSCTLYQRIISSRVITGRIRFNVVTNTLIDDNNTYHIDVESYEICLGDD